MTPKSLWGAIAAGMLVAGCAAAPMPTSPAVVTPETASKTYAVQGLSESLSSTSATVSVGLGDLRLKIAINPQATPCASPTPTATPTPAPVATPTPAPRARFYDGYYAGNDRDVFSYGSSTQDGVNEAHYAARLDVDQRTRLLGFELTHSSGRLYPSNTTPQRMVVFLDGVRLGADPSLVEAGSHQLDFYVTTQPDNFGAAELSTLELYAESESGIFMGGRVEPR